MERQPEFWLALTLALLPPSTQWVLSEAFNRITGYTLQYWDGTGWSNIVSGATIGHSKTFSFPVLTPNEHGCWLLVP
jgi:hypothetical protein